MQCPYCGRMKQPDLDICQSCGFAFQTISSENSKKDLPAAPNNHYRLNDNQITEEEYRLFIGRKSEYYLKRWENIEERTRKFFNINWNWASFLAGFFWMGYRKMYLYLLVYLGIFLCSDIIFSILGKSHYTYGLGVLLGLYGNYFYYQHTKKKILAIKKKHQNDIIEKNATLARAGGTSWAGVFITILIVLIYAVISTAITDTIEAPKAAQETAPQNISVATPASQQEASINTSSPEISAQLPIADNNTKKQTSVPANKKSSNSEETQPADSKVDSKQTTPAAPEPNQPQIIKILPQGATYEGEWSEPNAEGLIFPNGKGTLTLANGEEYVGQFKNGRKDGHGCYSWPSGQEYTGQWNNDLKDGKGSFIYTDEKGYWQRKEGYWKNDVYIGSSN